MNMRFKTYILILVLSLISVLIASLYLELISNAVVVNRSRENTVSDLAITVSLNQGDLAIKPEVISQPFKIAPFSSEVFYPPHPSPEIPRCFLHGAIKAAAVRG